tara:strand:- start:5979 stop:6683 length:705 start_codon:yes stop_codon:yes gene_type:complete
MGRAKDIVVKVIPAKVAVPFVKRVHYSGTVSNTSGLHFGVFLNGKMHGVMSFGSPMDKRKVITLVNNTRWNEMLELNRMAFDDFLPKNSESRALSIAFKLIRKNAPHIKWILSFSDGVQCGDGTIYRASGFELTGIKKSTQIIETPWGERVTRMTLTQVGSAKRQKVMRRLNIPETGKSSVLPFLKAGCRNVEGFQLRYIKILDKSCKLQCASIPFSKIKEVGAGMYKGEKTGG